MSGGHWDYSGSIIRDALIRIGRDTIAQKRWPGICQLFCSLAEIIDDTEHSMDWDLSGDTEIENDKNFEHSILYKVKQASNDALIQPPQKRRNNSMITEQELEHRFDYRDPNRGDGDRIIDTNCKNLAKLIIDNTPLSREQSIALTKLEEVMFWANAAISRNETRNG